jgi:UTP-glucose-1-phosphate uridylyltransferase
VRAFVMGRGKRAIEDHFMPDPKFIELLANGNGRKAAEDLERVYDNVRDSSRA